MGDLSCWWPVKNGGTNIQLRETTVVLVVSRSQPLFLIASLFGISKNKEVIRVRLRVRVCSWLFSLANKFKASEPLYHGWWVFCTSKIFHFARGPVRVAHKTECSVPSWASKNCIECQAPCLGSWRLRSVKKSSNNLFGFPWSTTYQPLTLTFTVTLYEVNMHKYGYLWVLSESRCNSRKIWHART